MNTISSNLQYAGACMSSTAKYVQDSVTPSKATMDKAYNVAMVALKAVAVLATTAGVAAIGYAISQSDISRETLAQASAAGVVAFIALNAYFFPESIKASDESQTEDDHFKKLADDDRRSEDIAKKEAEKTKAGITAAVSRSWHGGVGHAPVGTRK